MTNMLKRDETFRVTLGYLREVTMSFWSKLFGRENIKIDVSPVGKKEKREVRSPEKACITTLESGNGLTDNGDKPLCKHHNVMLAQIGQMTEDQRIQQEKNDVLWNLQRTPLTELVRHPHKTVVHSGEQWYEKIGADGKYISLSERLALFQDHEKNAAKSVSLLNRMVSGYISNLGEIDLLENEEQLPQSLFDQAKEYFKVIASRLVHDCAENGNETKGEIGRKNALRLTLEKLDSHKHIFRFDVVSNATLNEWGLERSSIAPESAWEQGCNGVFKFVIFLSHSLFGLRGNINPVSFLYDINLNLRLGVLTIAQEKLNGELLLSDGYRFKKDMLKQQLSKALEYTLRDLREISKQEGYQQIVGDAFLDDVRDTILGNPKERLDIAKRLELKSRNRETVRRNVEIGGMQAGLRPISRDNTAWDERFYIRYMILKKRSIELKLNRLKERMESYGDTEMHCLPQKALEQVVGEEAGYWKPGLTSYASEYRKEGEKWKIFMGYEIGGRRLQLLISQYTRICNQRYETEHPGVMEKFLKELDKACYGRDGVLRQTYDRGRASVRYRDLSGAVFSLSDFAQYGINVTDFLSALHDRMLLSRMFMENEERQMALKQVRNILRKQRDNITDADLFTIYGMMKKLEMSPFGVASELVSSVAPFVMVSEFGEFLTHHVYRETNGSLIDLLRVLKTVAQDINALIRRHFINIELVKP